jgi:hypothetical protein
MNPKRLLSLILLAPALYCSAEGWQRVTSSPIDSTGPPPLAVYVAPKSRMIYISDFSRIWRAPADEVENNPAAAHWTEISDGVPRGGARQFIETPAGTIVAIFGYEKSGVHCDNCNVAYFDGTKWSRSAIGLGNSNPMNLQLDSRGDVYVNAWTGCSVWRSKDGGRHFSSLTHRNLYEDAGEASGGCYAFTIYGDRAYWGGEGGDASTAPTELISMARSMRATGSNLQRWTSETGWQPVSPSAGYPAWSEPNLFHQAAVRGKEPHEYFIALGAAKYPSGGGIFVTRDAGVSWKLFDMTGLPQPHTNESYPLRMQTDPATHVLFVCWNGTAAPRALYLYKR